MTDVKPLTPLDFSSPRKPKKKKWRALSKWHQSVCMLTSESWNSLLSSEVSLAPTKIEPSQYKATLAEFPDDGIGLHFQIGQGQFPSMIVFSDQQLHGILADILNMPGEEWPEVRKFTRAEISMLVVLFHRLADAISDGIPGAEATSCTYVDMFPKPERTRLFAQVDEILVGEINITSRFGEDTALWLLPKRETEGLIGKELQEDEHEDRGVRPQLVSLAKRIEVDVVVELGRCDVTMSQVSRLTLGDVLVLDQSIHRPLTAYVANEAKWTGNPLKVGPRQGFEVLEMITDSTGPGIVAARESA